MKCEKCKKEKPNPYGTAKGGYDNLICSCKEGKIIKDDDVTSSIAIYELENYHLLEGGSIERFLYLQNRILLRVLSILNSEGKGG